MTWPSKKLDNDTCHFEFNYCTRNQFIFTTFCAKWWNMRWFDFNWNQCQSVAKLNKFIRKLLLIANTFEKCGQGRMVLVWMKHNIAVAFFVFCFVCVTLAIRNFLPFKKHQLTHPIQSMFSWHFPNNANTTLKRICNVHTCTTHTHDTSKIHVAK